MLQSLTEIKERIDSGERKQNDMWCHFGTVVIRDMDEGLFVQLSVCLFVCSFVRSFVRLFVCLFVCLFEVRQVRLRVSLTINS